MSTTAIRFSTLLALALLIGLLSASTQSAIAHDGDFNHYKNKHFYTKQAANDRFVVQRFAVVDSAGNLVRGDRVASATRQSAGVYRVNFNKVVAHCAFTVTPLAENGAVPVRFASASTGAIWGPKTVAVAVFSKTGDFLDGGFSLVMTC